MNNFRCFSLMAFLVCAVLAVPAHADDGCENEANDRITPELALCSVHAYNIGADTNPAGADRQLMKEIVALKTTVIAQQMNKQYEYMDAMIRRFKTQLEKAVLTTKLQAAGADTNGNTNGVGGGYSGGAYAGTGNGGAIRNDGRVTNIFLDGAQNCASKLDTADMISCLADNYSVIMDVTNSGQTVSADARKQLATDFNLLIDAGLVEDKQANNKCKSDRTMSQRSGLQECLTAHSSNIRSAKDKYNRDNRQDKK